MFGNKAKKLEREHQHEEEVAEAEAECAEAESLVKSTLDALNKGLAVKREAREKTSRFVGSLRPLVKP